jgi:hypothetical protein
LGWEKRAKQSNATKIFYVRVGENTSLFQGFYARSIRDHNFPNSSIKLSGLWVMGKKTTVALKEGRLDFDPWEQIFYDDFDGRRWKRELVKIIGE